MTETPANTPRPIGNTSNFFPGGSNGVGAPAFSEVAVGDGDGDNMAEGKARVDVPVVSGRESVFSGCGAAVGFDPPEDGTTTLLGTGDTELLPLGWGTKVSVSEITGGSTDPEPEGGKPVTVGSGRTVLEGTPVLERPSVLGRIPVEVEDSRSLVVVSDGDVGDGNRVDTIVLDAGGSTALGTPLLPLSGVTTQVFSSLTMSTPFTTVGVKVILHV